MVETQHRPARRSRTRTVLMWVGIVVGALLVLGVIGSAFTYTPPPPSAAAPSSPSTSSGEPAPVAPAPSSPEAAPAPTRASAAEVVEALGRAYPVPSPRDNTARFCTGGVACEQLVTTDAVSVSEWATPADARRWAEGLDGDAVGRFALTYSGSDQAATSEQTRREWAELLRRDYAGR